MPTVLSDRALNRALLARQWLLERVDRGVLETVGHLVGIQAQEPPDPYVALWSRIRTFDPAELGRAIEERRAVRIGVMRGTIHLLLADDALALRPLTQEVLDRGMRSNAGFRAAADAVDLGEVVPVARGFFEARPAAGPAIRAFVAERWPSVDAAALTEVIRFSLPLVQIPPRGVWGQTLRPTWDTLEHWLGRPLAEPDPAAVIRRYLAAFGPAGTADFGSWSRLTRVKELFAPLLPELETFEDSRGRLLYDLPDAPRPDPETPAPVRFLPQYDNVFLSHDDRARIAPDGTWERVLAVDPRPHFVLVDGVVAGLWKVGVPSKTSPLPVRGPGARLRITPFRPLAAADARALEEDGAALFALVAPESEAAVELAPPLLG